MTTKQQIQLEYDKACIKLKAELRQAISDRDFNRRVANDELVKVYRTFQERCNSLVRQRWEELSAMKLRHAVERAYCNESERNLLNVKFRAERRKICTRYEEELNEARRVREKATDNIRRDLHEKMKFYDEQVADINERMKEVDERYVFQMNQLSMYNEDIQDAEEVE